MLRWICAARALNLARVRRQLGRISPDAGSRVNPCAASACPEPRVGGDRGVADAVDRLQIVARPDRVESPPLPVGEHPGVDLQMEVAVRVTRTGRVVPDHRRLDLLHGHLHLPAPRPHPRGRVSGDPADDLPGGPLLCRIERRRHLRIQRRRERPGLRAVDRDLDEPQRTRRRGGADPCPHPSRRRPRPPTARSSRPSSSPPRVRLTESLTSATNRVATPEPSAR